MSTQARRVIGGATDLAPILVSPREYASAGGSAFLRMSHDVINLLSTQLFSATTASLAVFKIYPILAHQSLALLFVICRFSEHNGESLGQLRVHDVSCAQ